MSKRTNRAHAGRAEGDVPAPPPAAVAKRVDVQGSSPIPLAVLAFGLPLLLLIIGMILMRGQ